MDLVTADAQAEREHRQNPLLAGASGDSRSFDCSRYRPVPGSKRCQSYLDNGACSLPDELMCVEWLKANGQAPSPVTPPEAEPAPPPPGDLFGNPIPAVHAPAARSEKKPQPSSIQTPAGIEAPRSPLARIPDEDIASFKELGVEVCLQSDAIGEVWLVPEYTGRDRREITPEHAATLRLIIDAFPGARIVAFDKLRKESQ